MRASSLRIALALAMLWGSPASRAGDFFDRWEDTALYHFEYRVPLDGIPLGDSARARLWVPMPVDSDSQRVIESRVESPIPIGESLDAMGNRMAHLAWEGPVPAGAEAVFHYTVERAPDDGLSREEVSASRDDPARFLSPATRIPLEGMIKRLGEKHAEGSETDADKIRAYYDFVLKYMRYSKHGEGWGQGDASWACDSRYGNCTDFHSLFLGMARSQKIPARFVMGFPIAHDSAGGSVTGYHCWAEAWDPERGWVPFDASEAWKAGMPDRFFGRVPSDRIAFTLGRDLVLAPPQAGDALNYFIHPYLEIDGEPAAPIRAQYRFRRLTPPAEPG